MPENKDKIVGILKWGMIACGLWQRPVSKYPVVNKINYIHSVLARLNYVAFYVGILVECLRLIIQKYEGSVILDSFSVVITASKIIVIMSIYFKNDVLALLNVMTKKEAEIWEENDPDIVKMFNQKVKVATIFSRSLWVITILTVLAVNTSGVIGSLNLKQYNKDHNTTIESHFLYKFWFPANRLDHLFLVTVLSCVLSYGALIYNVTSNTIVVILCVHCATHLSVLQHRIRRYIPDDLSEEDMDKTILELTDLIFKHRYMIAFTTHLNDCSKNIIMMEFILTSVDVAMAALNIIKLNLSEMGWMVFYLPMLVIQIYSIAWSANEVNVQSQAVGDAVYESKWYLLNKKGKILSQLVIQRARERPLIMTIGPFGPMTLETFLMIMKAAYSYVSIMRK